MDLTNEEKIQVIKERIFNKDLLIAQYRKLVDENKDDKDYPLEKIEGYLSNIDTLNLMKEVLNNEIIKLT